MSEKLNAKRVVLVSTVDIGEQYRRLTRAIPELQDLLDRLAPEDPRRESVAETLRCAELAREWLGEYAGGDETYGGLLESDNDENLERANVDLVAPVNSPCSVRDSVTLSGVCKACGEIHADV